MSVQTANVTKGADAVRKHPIVQNAQTVRHDDSEYCTLEIVLLPSADRVPPGVLRRLAEHDCGIATVQPQGEFLVVEVR